MRIKQSELLEMIENDYTHKEMAKEKGVSMTTIGTQIKRIDPNLVKEAYLKAKQKEQEWILQQIGNGKSFTQMAKEKRVSVATISKKIREINPDLVEEARREAERREREEIFNLRQQNYTIRQIAEMKGMSTATIKSRLKQNNITKTSTLNSSFQIIQEKIKKNELKKKDVILYREILDREYKKVSEEQVNLLIRAYINIGQLQEAIYFINGIINNEDIDGLKIDKEKLKLVKEEIEQMQKKQVARKLIELEKSNEYIMNVTGLREVDIIRIRKEMKIEIGKVSPRPIGGAPR